MSNRKVSDVLSRLAFALEVADGASQKARAYQAASRTVRQLGDVEDLLARGELANVRGLGASSLKVIAEVVAGRVPAELERLEQSLPEGLFAIHRVPGLGPAKIRKLWQGLGITSLGELEHACKENRLVQLEGFGSKTQAKVLSAIEEIHRSEGILLRSDAMVLMNLAEDRLRGAAIRVAIVGDFRRGQELCADLAILVEEASGTDDALEGAGIHRAAGAEAWQFEGTALAVHRSTLVHWGANEVRLTSSEEHRSLLDARASSRGMTWTIEGLYRGSAPVACGDEDAFYAALGLYTTPAERRDPGVPLVEIGAARPKLIELRDLRGALHNHTTASDGSDTLEAMRAAADVMQLEYLGISDHSVSAHYAGGLSAEALHAQAKAIAALSGDGCVLLTGVESDILADGELDYPPEVLSRLEVVIASVHKRFSLDYESTTQRMIRAAQNPYTDVLGHPTGRLLLGRPSNAFDMEAMLDAARSSGCAVELNSSPHRLDLSAEHLAMAKARGVPISIAADAHATRELGYLRHGIAVARRAGLTAEDVLNTRTLAELRGWLGARRSRALDGPRPC